MTGRCTLTLVLGSDPIITALLLHPADHTHL
jgi:hypothetical protein